MAADSYEYEVGRGIRNSSDPGDDPGARCARGGSAAVKDTDPHSIPIIREWEFASGRIIAFSKIDSCLGAVQIASTNLLRGAHFSMFASGLMYDTPKFNVAMLAAGFQANLPILYFGGGVADWMNGLVGHAFGGVGPFPFPVVDAAQRMWIFEMRNGAFTYHSMV